MAEIKVTGPGVTVSTPGRTVSRPGKTGDSGAFARELGGAAETTFEAEVSAVDAPANVSGVEALLMAQAVDETQEREIRKRLVSRGEDILDRLDEIRHGLLMGSIPKDRLMALAQMVRARREYMTDPRLARILDEIELRAEVELAKLMRRA